MHSMVRSLLAPALVAGLLSACGGGVSLSFGFFEDDEDFIDRFDTRPSGRSGSLTVSAATDLRLNGVYSNADVWLSDVLRFSARLPETCRYRFARLDQAGTTRSMEGEIRYLAGSGEMRATFVAIDGLEFRHDGTAGATTDLAANRVTFSGAVLNSTRLAGQQITLTGTVPIRGETRPAGC
jgi:hypothetical protein